jgi:GT2 family glycosyltransferase
MSNPESSMEVKTNVVVISWNALDFTRTALRRLFETAHHPYTLTVVDNGSDDGTVEYLEALSPSGSCTDIRTVMNTRNLGPGGAYSQGYDVSRELGARYTALCNNDLYFQDQWLERLEASMDENETIGILGTLQPTSGVIHPASATLDAKNMLKSAPSGVSIREELDHFFQGDDFDKGAESIISANGGGIQYLESPPDAVPTSCAIVRNRAIEQVGFVADPRYEIYGSEDIDLAWELGKLGYRCAVQNDVYTHHFRHRSAKASGLDIKECLRENNHKFVDKWFDTIAALFDKYSDLGVRPSELMETEDNKSFLKLRRINDNVGFWRDGKLLRP